MPSFEKDIFISYAHADNEQWGPQNDRWIDSFHRALEIRLRELLGRPPAIWRDNKLRGTDEFGQEIIDQFPHTKILLLVLSPNYMSSEWCRKELKEFATTAQTQASPDIGNQSRICKVIKTHVAYKSHPSEIVAPLGYKFYTKDKDGRFQEFKSYPESPYCSAYWKKLEEAAYDIAKLVEKIEAGAAHLASLPEKTIYLAETTSDLKNDRKNIEQELEKRGFTILPDQPLFPDENFRQNAMAYLSRCKLSIHLIGRNYGTIPEGEDTSIVEIQNDLAAEQAEKGSISRLIRIPLGLEITDSRQQASIQTLEDVGPDQRGTRLIKTSFEDFKTIINDTLNNPLVPPPQKIPAPDEPVRIYLMHDRIDQKAVEPIEDYLFAKGFEVKVPLFDGSPSQLRELHHDYLRLCDAMMIYYEDTTHAWLESKLNDILKARGLDRSIPICGNAVYVTGEKTPHKERFRTHEAEVIKNFGPFQGEVLEPFIAGLQVSRGGAR